MRGVKMKKIISMMIGLLLFCTVVSAQCDVNVKSKTIDDFMQEIANIDEQVKECKPMLPKGLKSIYGNSNFEVRFGEHVVYGMVEDGVGKGINLEEPENVKYVVTVSEEDAESVLASDNRFVKVKELYENGKIEVEAKTFGSKFKLFFTKPLVKFGLKKFVK